jgi:hypothetical protein
VAAAANAINDKAKQKQRSPINVGLPKADETPGDDDEWMGE